MPPATYKRRQESTIAQSGSSSTGGSLLLVSHELRGVRGTENPFSIEHLDIGFYVTIHGECLASSVLYCPNASKFGETCFCRDNRRLQRLSHPSTTQRITLLSKAVAPATEVANSERPADGRLAWGRLISPPDATTIRADFDKRSTLGLCKPDDICPNRRVRSPIGAELI